MTKSNNPNEIALNNFHKKVKEFVDKIKREIIPNFQKRVDEKITEALKQKFQTQETFEKLEDLK